VLFVSFGGIYECSGIEMSIVMQDEIRNRTFTHDMSFIRAKIGQFPASSQLLTPSSYRDPIIAKRHPTKLIVIPRPPRDLVFLAG
jgi:hypothetical protein